MKCRICKKRKADRCGGLMCRKCNAKSKETIKLIRVAFGFAPLSSILPEGSPQRKNLEEREAAQRFLQDDSWNEKRFQEAIKKRLAIYFKEHPSTPKKSLHR